MKHRMHFFLGRSSERILVIIEIAEPAGYFTFCLFRQMGSRPAILRLRFERMASASRPEWPAAHGLGNGECRERPAAEADQHLRSYGPSSRRLAFLAVAMRPPPQQWRTRPRPRDRRNTPQSSSCRFQPRHGLQRDLVSNEVFTHIRPLVWHWGTLLNH
jgi:hypothetical protein